MFSKIDMFLITWTQWFVRQAELYTPIERKNFLSIFINLLKWVIVTWGIVSMLVAITSFPSFISFPLLFISEAGCLLFLKDFFCYVNLSKKITTTGKLPTEIASRYTIRHTYFLFVLFGPITIWCLHLMTTSRYTDLVIISIYIIGTFCLVCFHIYLCIEYLLCTTSLPPGEKERRGIEKEISSLVLVPIKN